MPCLTVGHSNHELPALIALLHGAGVRRVIDVRSWPRSRHAPQFDRESLARALGEAGLAYEWRGKLLGGLLEKIAGETTDDYWRRLRALPRFQEGVAALATEETDDVALLCAERDPINCHRFRAIAEELTARGVAVAHLLADGAIVAHERLLAQTKAAQLSLF
ncbi:MAG TPA: DUF488 domain-containing protein [bacterium]|nr:DUF488 domain-containing protein [bacterium]